METPARKALLVGATGLVGSRVLALLLDDGSWDQVHVLARRPTGVAHPRLSERTADFGSLDRDALPAVDDVFCCLGTTIKAAGSRAKFRAVDYAAVVAVARLALEQGAQHFLLVTAMGADPGSTVFYNRVKGDTEQAVQALGYRALSIFRPSFISGIRREKRSGENLAVRVLGPLSFLIPRKYRPVADLAVAKAMVDAAKRAEPGVHIVESDQMQPS